MSTAACCGDLSYVRVWHDNSGEGNANSWYLHKIVITDLQTNARYVRVTALSVSTVLYYNIGVK